MTTITSNLKPTQSTSYLKLKRCHIIGKYVIKEAVHILRVIFHFVLFILKKPAITINAALIKNK